MLTADHAIDDRLDETFAALANPTRQSDPGPPVTG